MAVFVTGDCHGDVIERFSFKRHSQLRELTANDYMIVAGDFGAVWAWTQDSKDDLYRLNFVNDKPWSTIVVLGNHENWDAYEAMPKVTPDFLCDGSVRLCVYMGKTFEHIFVVDSIATLDLCGKHILCLAGADSHDKEWRTEGKTWWPQETINIDVCDSFIKNHLDEHFDLIVSHDAPGQINRWYHRKGESERFYSSPAQEFLDWVAENLNFDSWIHVHFHFDNEWPSSFSRLFGEEVQVYPNWFDKMLGIYHRILQIA